MRIVGVVDLKNGRAVHARGGDRRRYQPVGRAGGVHLDGDASALARFYRDECGVTNLYVADLDAIGGGMLQRTVLGEIATATRNTSTSRTAGSMWLDAGVASPEAADAAFATGADRVIVGLETLPGYDDLARICAGAQPGRVMLSLDLCDGQLVCQPGSALASESIEAVAQHAASCGVRAIVVLDLSRVGRGQGPAVGEIARVLAAVPGVEVYAGGGIGAFDDLRRLQALGVTGALIASALQDGRLTSVDLRRLASA